jgi:hypothetical protein
VQLSLVQGAARRLGLPLHVADFMHPPYDHETAIAGALRAKADALLVPGSPLWVKRAPPPTAGSDPKRTLSWVGLRERRRSLNNTSAREIAAAVRGEFVYKLPRVRRQ